MRGLGRIFKRGQVYWIAYHHRGKEYRESSGSPDEKTAREMLAARIAGLVAGRFLIHEDRVTFHDLERDLMNDCRLNRKKSLPSILSHLGHLRDFFGRDRAVDLTSARIREYQVHRLARGAAPASANREVAVLSKMLSLAVEAGKISRRPSFRLLAEDNTRRGFLDRGDFLRVLQELPLHLRHAAEFLYLSGWRKGEIAGLEWNDVDLHNATVRLGDSKNGEGRVLPLSENLLGVIQERRALKDPSSSLVFHRDGSPLGDFRKSWRAAVEKAGLPGTLVHDLRRSAARNYSRAGVREEVAMALLGHKTRSMYRRYNIVDETDLKDATKKLQGYLKEGMEE